MIFVAFIGFPIVLENLLVAHFLLPTVPYVVALSGIIGKFRHHNPIKMAVLGGVLFISMGYPWIDMISRLFGTKMPTWISGCFNCVAQISLIMLNAYIWIELVGSDDPRHWLIDPAHIVIFKSLPWVLTASTVFYWARSCFIGNNHGDTDDFCSHGQQNLVCIDCIMPFALIACWIAPRMLLERLRDPSLSVFYGPIHISNWVPHSYDTYVYLFSAAASLALIGFLSYQGELRSIGSVLNRIRQRNRRTG